MSQRDIPSEPFQPRPLGRRVWVISWAIPVALVVVLGLTVARALSLRDVAPAPRPGPELLDVRGRACLEASDTAGAERCWREAVARDPGRAGTWLELGRLALRVRRPVVAVSDLEQARSLAPDRFETLQGLAFAHHLLGHDAEARDFQLQADRARRALPPATGGMGADAMPIRPGAMP
jgi:cytochrome c-type biogenesis protein CcmH/NrfG